VPCEKQKRKASLGTAVQTFTGSIQLPPLIA